MGGEMLSDGTKWVAQYENVIRSVSLRSETHGEDESVKAVWETMNAIILDPKSDNHAKIGGGMAGKKLCPLSLLPGGGL
jgi:hypothetical protein